MDDPSEPAGPATEVFFYHMTRSRLDAALPALLTRCRQREWRALVRVGDPSAIAPLSRALWTWRDEAFLAHGGPEDGRPERQPIYLTAGDERPNRADVAFFALGAVPDFADWRTASPAPARLCLLFDGADADAVATARAAWRSAKAEGFEASYWAERDGRGWSKEA